MGEVLTIVERVMFLSEIEMFKKVGTKELAHIAAMAEEHFYKAGERFMKPEDPTDRLFIVVEGEVELTSKSGTAYYWAKEGMEFGLSTVLVAEEQEIGSSAEAKVDSTVLTISRKAFLESIADNSELAVGLIQSLAEYYLKSTYELAAKKRRVRKLERIMKDSGLDIPA